MTATSTGSSGCTPCSCKAMTRMPACQASLHARQAVFHHGAAPGRDAQAFCCEQEQGGIGFPALHVVGAEDAAGKMRQQSGHAQAQLDLVMRGVGRQGEGQVQLLHHLDGTVDGLQVLLQHAAHEGAQFLLEVAR